MVASFESCYLPMGNAWASTIIMSYYYTFYIGKFIHYSIVPTNDYNYIFAHQYDSILNHNGEFGLVVVFNSNFFPVIK